MYILIKKPRRTDVKISHDKMVKITPCIHGNCYAIAMVLGGKEQGRKGQGRAGKGRKWQWRADKDRRTGKGRERKKKKGRELKKRKRMIETGKRNPCLRY